jgi:hypothetical protein
MHSIPQQLVPDGLESRHAWAADHARPVSRMWLWLVLTALQVHLVLLKPDQQIRHPQRPAEEIALCCIAGV